jgi:hypothetical protein
MEVMVTSILVAGERGTDMGVKVKIEGIEGGLNSQTGKSDEIAIVEELHRKFSGSGTYLEHLFSMPFVEWVKSQIKDDLSCDIHSDLVAAGMEVSRLNSLNAALSQVSERNAKGLEEEISKWKARWQEKENDDARHVQELADRRREWQEERNGLVIKMNEMEERIDQECHDALKLADEVVSLKAKLYDLITKKEGDRG